MTDPLIPKAEPAVPQNDPGIWDEQIYKYAEELQELYIVEQKERQALAEEKLVLEYRLRELSSLNQLFQKQLERMEEMTSGLRDVRDGLRNALKGTPEGEAQRGLLALVAIVEGLIEARPPAQ